MGRRKRVLLDANVIIDFHEQRAEIRDAVEELRANRFQLLISDITKIEVLRRLGPGKRKDRILERKRVLQELGTKFIPVTSPLVHFARGLIEEYCLERTMPEEKSRAQALICDMILGATALKLGIPLVTEDTDFEWLESKKGLEVIWLGLKQRR